MAKTTLTATEKLLVDGWLQQSSATVLGHDDYELLFRPIVRMRRSLNDLPPTAGDEKDLLKKMANYLELVVDYLHAKSDAMVVP